jgi:DNA polymerase III epsilon subunit-like protein
VATPPRFAPRLELLRHNCGHQNNAVIHKDPLIRAIDIETTGTDPANDAIIEIANVDMLCGGDITNAMNTLVRRPFTIAGRHPHHKGPAALGTWHVLCHSHGNGTSIQSPKAAAADAGDAH